MMLGSRANSKHGMIIGKSARKCRNKKALGKTGAWKEHAPAPLRVGVLGNFAACYKSTTGVELMVSTPEYPWSGS